MKIFKYAQNWGKNALFVYTIGINRTLYNVFYPMHKKFIHLHNAFIHSKTTNNDMIQEIILRIQATKDIIAQFIFHRDKFGIFLIQ